METALFLGVSQGTEEVLQIAKGKRPSLQAMYTSRKNVMCSKEAQTQISTDLDKY